MTVAYIACAILTMALVTYIPRVLPLVAVRRKIKSPFINSFLYYMPYAVLAGMTFPAILYATSSVQSAAAALAAALLLSYFGRGLVSVALAAVVVAFLVERVM